jgi:hypothetical protein
VAFKPSLIGILTLLYVFTLYDSGLQALSFWLRTQTSCRPLGGGGSPSNSWPSLCRMLVLLRTLFHTVMCPLFGRQQIVCGFTALVFWCLIGFLGGGDLPPRFLVVLLGSL